jgi:hypothetical protein
MSSDPITLTKALWRLPGTLGAHKNNYGTHLHHRACTLCLALIAALIGIFPNKGECQLKTLIKPVAIPILKRVVGDVVIQGSTDAVITTGISTGVTGEFTPGISDPQFEQIPKVFEYVPVTAELIDVATIAQGVWELRMTYLAMEEERASRAAVDRMIKKMQATARDREMRMKIDRAAWFRAHLQRLIDANILYNSAKTAEEREAALSQINAIMKYARMLAGQIGINNVDLSVLTPAQAQTIAVKFFDYDLVSGHPVGQ